MTTLESWISKACEALGLHADFAFVVDIGGGHRLVTVARIRNLGDQNGMLIFRDSNDLGQYGQRLVQHGYGYSVLGEPRADEMFDLESYREMFRDWGWSGPDAERPQSLF